MQWFCIDPPVNKAALPTGDPEANAQVILKSICMNLKKAASKIFVDKPAWGAVRPNVA